MPTMNIFERLEEIGICYAICVSRLTVKAIPDTTWSQRQAHIIISMTDRLKILPIRFYEGGIHSHYKIFERQLNATEIELFDELIDSGYFVKTLHNKHGFIFELADNSFIEYFKSIPIEKFKEERKQINKEKIINNLKIEREL